VSVYASALETAAVEEGLLLGRGLPSKHRIAMRKAAEPADDVGVDVRPFEIVFVAQAR
jgi:hypothetical protein